jgi:hypothetical protein
MTSMAKKRPIPLSSVQPGLTHRQKTFIHVYLGAKTIEDACRHAKVAKGTVYNWLQTPLFQKELDRQREVLLKTAFHRLNAYLDQAITSYVGLLTSENEWVRRLTAEGIMDRILKIREQEGLIERIERLEQIIQERKP